MQKVNAFVVVCCALSLSLRDSPPAFLRGQRVYPVALRDLAEDHGAKQESEAKSILAEWNAQRHKITSLHCRYSVTRRNKVVGTQTTFQGEAWYVKPNVFRFDCNDAHPFKLFVEPNQIQYFDLDSRIVVSFRGPHRVGRTKDGLITGRLCQGMACYLRLVMQGPTQEELKTCLTTNILKNERSALELFFSPHQGREFEGIKALIVALEKPLYVVRSAIIIDENNVESRYIASAIEMNHQPPHTIESLRKSLPNGFESSYAP
jgi:hypothetical protein